MRYKGPNDLRTRELRRLWAVEIYEGNPDDPEVTIHRESIIAWNPTDAIRRCGERVATQPESLGFITWDDEPLFIESTKGPTDRVAEPTIEVKEAEWDF